MKDWSGQATPGAFCAELRKYDQLWNTGGREHAADCPVHNGPNGAQAFGAWRDRVTT